MYAIIYKTFEGDLCVDSVHGNREDAELRYQHLYEQRQYKRVYLREVENNEIEVKQRQWVVLLIQGGSYKTQTEKHVGPFRTFEEAEQFARQEVWNNVLSDENDEAHIFQIFV